MKIKKLKEANVNARYNPKYTAKEVAKDVKVKLDALIAELVDTYGFTVMKSATVMNVFKNEPYWAMQDMENTDRALTDRERWVGEDLNESTANSNGVYSLYNGWLKEPVRDEIPDDMMLEPELSEWRKRAEDLATIEDIDAYIDDLYKLRQESILKDGEYGRENQIFKAIRNEGILQALKDKKVELENKEMSLESLDEALEPVPKGTTIVQTKKFEKDFRKLGLDDDDLIDLEESIMTYPPEASLGSNVYKFRWSPKRWGQGQSNGARLIYIYLLRNQRVYLMKIYRHNQQDNLSEKELKVFRDSAKLL